MGTKTRRNMRFAHVLCVSFLAAAQGFWESTGWRLTPSVPTGDMGDGWTVREVQFYERSDCGGDPIPHASTIPAQATAIVDGRTDSSYEGCNPCDPHQEYVGYRTATPTVARCLKIFQCYGSGCVPFLLVQAEADGQWLDVMTFKARGADKWTIVELDIRPPNLPPPPPLPPPPSSPPAPPGGSSGEASQGLSVGAIAGIAAGGSIGLFLVLAICGISVYVCRKMNRELKQAKLAVKPGKPHTSSTATRSVEGSPAPAVQGDITGAAIELTPC